MRSLVSQQHAIKVLGKDKRHYFLFFIAPFFAKKICCALSRGQKLWVELLGCPKTMSTTLYYCGDEPSLATKMLRHYPYSVILRQQLCRI